MSEFIEASKWYLILEDEKIWYVSFLAGEWRITFSYISPICAIYDGDGKEIAPWSLS